LKSEQGKKKKSFKKNFAASVPKKNIVGEGKTWVFLRYDLFVLGKFPMKKKIEIT